ncbi:ATP-binding protein [Litorivita sp. NS0012-18]|uniref:ATP-binding protein n=1 Tax=Litorivita sp. NS0012-18 TaxID=3127655 RepID=UPI0031041DF6
MSFLWLKRYMPRSLYGRALLILVLPVVTLQLVVTVLFLQRHFEGVTEEMTRNIAREVQLLLDAADTPAEQGALALALDIDLQRVKAMPRADLRRWFDLSGLVVIREISALLPQVSVVELPDDYTVRLYVEGPQGPLQISFDRRRVATRNPHQLFVNMLFFGGLMTLIAFVYLRNQLRPITRLARAAEAFGRGRHVPYRPAGANEVRAAGHAFVDMRARIERHLEQRTLMLSGVSHDLRTPLTRLRLGLSLIDDADAEAMVRDVDDMQRLLDEFLSFARGASEGEPEKTDPIALVRQIIEDAARAGQNVTLIAAQGEGELRLRPMAIRRAVENLIGNGVHYGTRVEVSVSLTEKSLRIRVEDDGPGIAEAQREEALKPFARLEPARNQNRSTGVGLGLSIANDTARAHGGILRLGESERLGGLRADIVIAR